MTDYQLLGVTAEASDKEIRKAFRRKALKLHPDHGGTDQAFRQLKAAFERLLIRAPRQQTVEFGFDSNYDPFQDSDYGRYAFFAPELDKIAEFERSARAQGCTHCGGLGIISKLVHPEKGFLGREERFCKCQIVN